jgi:hypothetical protein
MQELGSFHPACTTWAISHSLVHKKWATNRLLTRTEVLSTFPAEIFPGQRAIKGTPIPPSINAPLKARLPPVIPLAAPIPYPGPVAES